MIYLNPFVDPLNENECLNIYREKDKATLTIMMLQSRRYLSTGPIRRSFLRKPAIDVGYVVKNIKQYQDSIKKRQLVYGDELIQKLNSLENQYHDLKLINKNINEIQRERHQLEDKIKIDRGELTVLLPQIRKLKETYKDYFEKQSDLTSVIEALCTSLPNLIHESVHPTEPKIVEWINGPIKTNHNKDHVEIMTAKGLLEMEQASKTSGTSSYYLMGDAARLEQALINYSIDVAVNDFGFKFTIPPSLTKIGMIEACGFRPRDMNGEEQIYKTGKDMGLVATSEISLAALGYDRIMEFDDANDSVKKFVGLSRCYRAEAGARGRDTRGLYRVHEFSKVELFCWSKPLYGEETLALLKEIQIKIIKSLGLYAKVINMPAYDLGNPAYQKYDIEAWMPGRNSFGEVSSASTCRDFQSRRLNSRYRNSDGNLEYLYTLNGTAMAVPRIIVAIVENLFDNETNLIKVPQPLIPYMGNKEYI